MHELQFFTFNFSRNSFHKRWSNISYGTCMKHERVILLLNRISKSFPIFTRNLNFQQPHMYGSRYCTHVDWERTKKTIERKVSSKVQEAGDEGPFNMRIWLNLHLQDLTLFSWSKEALRSLNCTSKSNPSPLHCQTKLDL